MTGKDEGYQGYQGYRYLFNQNRTSGLVNLVVGAGALITVPIWLPVVILFGFGLMLIHVGEDVIEWLT